MKLIAIAILPAVVLAIVVSEPSVSRPSLGGIQGMPSIVGFKMPSAEEVANGNILEGQK